MKTIYKYRVPMPGPADIRMPQGAIVLSFQTQNGAPFIWALVDEDEPVAVKELRMYGTGHPVEDVGSLKFIGTTQQGPFVWHLFEKR